MKRTFVVISIGISILVAVACIMARQTSMRSSVSGLKGQRNTKLTFYGIVVDQEGYPLQSATIEYRVESYPKDWTYETRGRLNDVSYVSFTSGPDGKFRQEISGCTMRRRSATLVGYRHFAETDLDDNAEHAQTEWYCLIAQGDPWFKSDPAHPAIYVFVKDGAKEVSALPSHGGYSSGGSTIWHLNEPGWPKEPSLKDVVRKLPTTAAAITLPSTQP